MGGAPEYPDQLSPEGTWGSRRVGPGQLLATPEGTARVLRAYGLRPRKRWGQHFLVSRKALERILAVAEIGQSDTVLEIGAGLGTLTVALAERAGHVIAVEVDPSLLPPLREAVGAYSNVTVVHADIMGQDVGDFFDTAGPRKVVANLPYYLASSLVVSLLEEPLGLARLVLTVQREVAERLTASPGSRDYGALSVVVQYRATAAIVGRIAATAFYPLPEVESAIVLLKVRERPAVAVDNEAAFFRVVRASFAQRRKTLRNALASTLPLAAAQVEAACLTAGIDPRRRGETLSLEEFAALTRAVGASTSRGDSRLPRKKRSDD